MKNAKRYTALLLCLAVIFSMCSFTAFAEDIEVDLGDLFKPSTDDTTTDDDKKDDTTTDDKKDDTNAGDATTDKKGSGGVTSIDLTSKNDKDTTDDGSGLRKDDTTTDKTEETVYNSTFTDVEESSWYYEYVTPLAAKGIIEGYPDGTFLPQKSITRAEFIKLLVTSMGYELTESDEFTDVTSAQWYYSVVSTAVKNNVINKKDYGETFKPDEYIKRDEVAQLLVNATGVETDKYESPYVDTKDKNIVALYSICLMQGSKDDETGGRYFFPETNITRAETSAVFTRLLEYNADKETFVKNKLEEYGISLKLLYVPQTSQEFYKSMLGVGISPASFFSFERAYGDPRAKEELTDNFIEAYHQCSSSRPEYFTLMAMNVRIRYSSDITEFTLNLYSASEQYGLEELWDMENKSFEAAKDIAKTLLEENPDADDITMAKAIHDYLILNTSYASESEDDAKFTAYGALINGSAVCQGYASAFNILCSLCGVKSCAIASNNHMWNAVMSDGNITYYDCTFDDPIPDIPGRVLDNYCGISAYNIANAHGDFTLPLAFYFDLR